MAEFSRNFHRRGGKKSEAGQVSEGIVTLAIPDGPWFMDGKELPAATVARLMDQSFSPLTDSYAGEAYATIAAARGGFVETYNRLLAGTSGARSSGGGVGAQTREIRLVIKAILKDDYPENFAEIKAMETADANAALDGVYDDATKAEQKAIAAQADDNLTRKAAEKAAREAAAASSKVTLKLGS